MRLLVFSIILSFNAFAKFDFKQCINSSFSEEIKHKGKFFGLIKHDLKVKKDFCVIDISFKKFTTKNWVIDICREPIHIKKKGSGVEVFKRHTPCESDPKQSYCYEEREVFSVIQDDGLIFASGERETLDSQHGKIYCTFLLLKKYLQNGMILSRNTETNLYQGLADSSKNCDTAKPIVVGKPVAVDKLPTPVTAPMQDENPASETAPTEAAEPAATPVGEF